MTFFVENYIMSTVIVENRTENKMEAGEIPVQVRYCKARYILCSDGRERICGNRILLKEK